MKKLFLAALLLGGCATTKQDKEPVVVTQEVKVPVPVPCTALAQLGAEPPYADTDEALKAAPDIFTRVQLLLMGRLQRVQRLAEYKGVADVCRK